MEQGKTKSLVQEQSFRFAVKVVNYAYRQPQSPLPRVLIRQLLRSGTSIGANIEEALGGQSRKDFIAKLTIAAKEARETSYWLRLIRDTQPHGTEELTTLLNDCGGLIRMLNSIILTSRSKSASDSAIKSQPNGHLCNSALSTQNPEPSTRNSELRTPNPVSPGNSELFCNSEPLTQNSELRTFPLTRLWP